MAAPAAAGGIRFKVFDLNTQNTLIDGVKPHPGDDLSPPFDPDAHTFLDVMAWRLDSHPRDRDRVWRVGPRNLIIGIDVSLDTPLRDWMAVLDLRADGVTPAPLRPNPMLNLSVEYEKVQYALAANAAGLAWPLWDAADTDPINMQAMGAHDNLRNRRGSQGVPPEENNGIYNLIGLRRGRHLKFVNMRTLAASLVHGNRREPAFHTEIADIESFGRHLLIAMQRSTSPSQSDPQHTLLPIIDLVTGAVDRRYGSAFSAYERRMKNKPLSEAAIRVANHGKEQSVAAGTYLAQTVLRQRIQDFVRQNPDASLADVEADSLRMRDWIPATRDFSDADVLQIARDVHKRMNPAVVAADQLRNQRGIAAAAVAAMAEERQQRAQLVAFVRAFLRRHPGVMSAGAEQGVQKVREWIAATGDDALGRLLLLVREEYPRALAGERPVAAAGSPQAAMAAQIHAFVRSNPDISRDELEQGMQQLRGTPFDDVMAIVREEQQRMQQPAVAGRVAPNPLIEMYKTAFWAGGQEADPVDNARAALEAIRAGGLAPGVVRAFQRMLQSVGDIQVQFEDVADRDARRYAMITAIHARYPAEGEEEEEEKGEPAANRLAARMERQLRW